MRKSAHSAAELSEMGEAGIAAQRLSSDGKRTVSMARATLDNRHSVAGLMAYVRESMRERNASNAAHQSAKRTYERLTRGEAYPVTQDSVMAATVRYVMEEGNSSATTGQWLSRLQHALVADGVAWPFVRAAAKGELRQLLRELATAVPPRAPRRAQALRREHVNQLHDHVHRSGGYEAMALAQLQVLTLLTIGQLASMRLGELTTGRLRMGDLRVLPPKSGRHAGAVMIDKYFGKVDKRTAAPRQACAIAEPGDRFSVATLWSVYQAELAKNVPRGARKGITEADAAAFPLVDQHGRVHVSKQITPRVVVRRAKVLLQEAGIADLEFHGHALRPGGATHLLALGLEDSVVKKMGGWSSKAYLGYDRRNDDETAAIVWQQASAAASTRSGRSARR